MNANSSTKNNSVASWLKTATSSLKNAGIGTARLDCLVLLEDELNTNRTQLLAEPHRQLSHEQLLRLNALVSRRLTHEPLAYIRGKAEFYGRQFRVNRNVLDPRPETETMIDLFKKLPLEGKPTAIDVGTGSGAIGITIKLERPNANVMATDIDAQCLKVAKQNAKALNSNIEILKTDLLNGLELTADSMVLANLPYVPDDYAINQAAMNEPRLAIFGGPDGLDLYRRLFGQIADVSRHNPEQPVYVLTESLPFQHSKLAGIATQNGYRLKQTADFIQLFMRR